MNAVTGIAASIDVAVSGGQPAPLQFTLRRTGRKAVRFNGWQVVDARGVGEPGTMWYDLAMYRSDTQAIVVELIARRHALDEQDMCRVEIFSDMDAAAVWLESYACGTDVPIPASLAQEDGPVAMAVLRAIQLRQRIARIHDDYQGLVSDVFDALDMTDAPSLTCTCRQVPEERCERRCERDE